MLSLVAGLVVAPVAHAIFQVVGLALLAGATPELAISTLAAALGVGSVVGFVNFKSSADSTGAAALHVQIAPDAPLPTPSGWTAPAGSGSAGEPTPPGTAATSTNAKEYFYNGSYPTLTGACQAFLAANPTCGGHACNSNLTGVTESGVTSWTISTTILGSCQYNYCADSGCTSRIADTYSIAAANSSSTSCPAGYTLSGGTCNLSNANDVQKPSDGKCGVKLVGNTFQVDGRDGDCATLPNSVSIGSGYVSVVDADGNAHSVTIDSGTGRSTIISDHANGDGTTTRSTTALGTPSGTGAEVTGQKVETYTGTGDQIAGSPNANVSVVNPCGGIGQPPCKIDESGTPTGVGDATGAAGEAAKSDYDLAKARMDAATTGGTVGELGIGLNQWTAPGSSDADSDWTGGLSSAECSSLELTMWGRDFELAWCPVVEYLRPVIDWGAGMFVALYVWSAFYRRRQGDA